MAERYAYSCAAARVGDVHLGRDQPRIRGRCGEEFLDRVAPVRGPQPPDPAERAPVAAFESGRRASANAVATKSAKRPPRLLSDLACQTGAMAEWIYFLHPPRDNFAATMTEAEGEVFAAHFARFQRLLADGIIIMVGPTLGVTTPASRSSKHPTRSRPAPSWPRSGDRGRHLHRRAATVSSLAAAWARLGGALDSRRPEISADWARLPKPRQPPRVDVPRAAPARTPSAPRAG